MQVFILGKVRRKRDLKGASLSLQPVISLCNPFLPCSSRAWPAVPTGQHKRPWAAAQLSCPPVLTGLFLAGFFPESKADAWCACCYSREMRRRFIAAMPALPYLISKREGAGGWLSAAEGAGKRVGTVLPHRGWLERAAATKQVRSGLLRELTVSLAGEACFHPCCQSGVSLGHLQLLSEAVKWRAAAGAAGVVDPGSSRSSELQGW